MRITDGMGRVGIDYAKAKCQLRASQDGYGGGGGGNNRTTYTSATRIKKSDYVKT